MHVRGQHNLTGAGNFLTGDLSYFVVHGKQLPHVTS